MTLPPSELPRHAQAPVHLWLVGILLVLWNSWGLFGAIVAQVDLLPEMPAEASEYFASQPLWFVLFADISPLAGIAGSLALLLQSRWAPTLYQVQIGVLVLANGYEALAGTSLLLTSRWAVTSTLFLLVILAGQFLYARWMLRRGVLT